jgi:hypothetical protein
MKKVYCKDCENFHQRYLNGYKKSWCMIITDKISYNFVEGPMCEVLEFSPKNKDYPNRNFDCPYYKEKKWYKLYLN